MESIKVALISQDFFLRSEKLDTILTTFTHIIKSPFPFQLLSLGDSIGNDAIVPKRLLQVHQQQSLTMETDSSFIFNILALPLAHLHIQSLQQTHKKKQDHYQTKLKPF